MTILAEKQPLDDDISQREVFKQRGFIRLSAEAVLSGLEASVGTQPVLDILITEFDSLPPDQYGDGENRYRRHSRAVFFPWSREISWLPNRTLDDGSQWTEYFQGVFHPDFRNDVRLFPAVSQSILANPSIHSLIKKNFELTFWDEFHQRQPMMLGISLIKMQIEVGQQIAFSTPNALHQDGETFTFAHLVERKNCIGGENVIADVEQSGKTPSELLPSQIHAAFTLENPLDSYAVHDPAISHYVAPIRPSDQNTPAARSIMLIDFTPLVSEHQIS